MDVAGGRSVFTQGSLGKNSVINLKILTYFKNRIPPACVCQGFWLVFPRTGSWCSGRNQGFQANLAPGALEQTSPCQETQDICQCWPSCYICVCAISDFYYCSKLPMTRVTFVLVGKQFLTAASNQHLKVVIAGVENH